MSKKEKGLMDNCVLPVVGDGLIRAVNGKERIYNKFFQIKVNYNNKMLKKKEKRIQASKNECVYSKAV